MRMRLLLALIIGTSLQVPLLAASQEPDIVCPAPMLGQYLIVSEGQRDDQPLGRLQLERWSADGSVSGVRFLRVGRTYSETRYDGRWNRLDGCSVSVIRDQNTSPSHVLLSDQGLPRFGLSTRPGDVVAERWVPQPVGPCRPEAMNGVVMSLQEGRTLTSNRWVPNAVIQKETWADWTMAGLAVSSYNGANEVATYQGEFVQKDNCIGRIRQQDARGVSYVYAAILRSDGGGYAYLQTQGDDLTVALLERSPLYPSSLD